MLENVKLKLVVYRGEIDVLAGAYAIQRYCSGRKPNSIKADQSAILNLYRFCEGNDIDLVYRIANQQPLTIGEIEAFSLYCSFRRDDGERAGVGLYKSRMRVALGFISYIWMFHQDALANQPDKLEASRTNYERMERAFKIYEKAPYQGERKDKLGLTENLQTRFFEIISPAEGNTLNPWRSHKIKWRNYILLMLIVLSGNRKGETLQLKLNHLQLTGPRKYFEILKPKKEISYIRAEAPSIKTLGRQVDLHEDFAELLIYYIENIRTLFRGGSKTSFVFISHRDGCELSLQTPNAILNDVVKLYPEFKGLLSPHRLRNTFHDLLNEALEKKFKDESPLSKKILKSPIQEAAGGWTHGSEMPDHYSKGNIQARVSDFHLKIQEQIASKLFRFDRDE